MLFELIAAIVSGVALAGVAMALRWLSRGLLPKWIVPTAAGLGMLAYAVWSEYSWYDRMTTGRPDSVVIAWKHEAKAPWRPWSYLYPVVDRFVAVDNRTAQRNPDFPDQVIVNLALAARWQLTAQVKVAFDCARHRRADLFGRAGGIGENGEIAGAAWQDLAADDPVLRAACR
ncbi:hypothetical protein [Rhizobium halophytocola]|uniref:Uncharacterized protein n=1 Tax=Rhizobium halophytocola TaxID=735519 RepID=A0ABS4DTS0_9HYPH|nr:hypothetical protein [Rhizobium halophytocola]MBP1849103.1 hypothetical protein [Rhizobium halophytocola]